MTVQEIMTANPIHVTEDATLQEVEGQLYDLDIRHIPVTRAHGILVGILSDRDIREYAFEGLGNVTAGEAMRGDVLMLHPDSHASEALELLLEHRVGAIPVVDPIEDKLVGIVSYIDLLKLMQDQFNW